MLNEWRYKCNRSSQEDDHRMGRNGHRKLCGEDREGRKLASYLVLLYISSHSEPCPNTYIPSPFINITRQMMHFFFNQEESKLTHHNHPKSTGYIGVHLVLYTLWVLTTIIMAYIYHYNIIQCTHCSKFLLPAYSFLPQQLHGNN